jgi:hypothetical protein
MDSLESDLVARVSGEWVLHLGFQALELGVAVLSRGVIVLSCPLGNASQNYADHGRNLREKGTTKDVDGRGSYSGRGDIAGTRCLCSLVNLGREGAAEVEMPQ